ncbi:MAG: hypothetical protein IPL26_29985 [Leptospiraceae bacterium]|nr:hypothetical protein [Leptospiraceae bacterium]
MIVDESIINQIIREIDTLYYQEQTISSEDADDLQKSVQWIIGKSLNESNVSYVIELLRSFKKTMNEQAVSSIIKSFRRICGSYMQ